ncbi:hypothetical protein JAB8_09150 [Janthinobacterium sp. HH106]|nr:hypothetical protein JAB8_09150 [Janthinobacterium sp. HH106]
MEEFNKSVNAVSNLRQNMIQIQYQSNNPQMLMAMNSMVSSAFYTMVYLYA